MAEVTRVRTGLAGVLALLNYERADAPARGLDGSLAQDIDSRVVATRNEIAWVLTADTPVVNIAAIIIYTNGATTVTMTFAGLSCSGNPGLPIQTGSGVSLFQYNLIGKPGSLVIT